MLPRSAVRVVGGLALAGAVACTPAEPETEAPPREEAGPEFTLRLAEPTHHFGDLAREPMLAEHPGGALFLAGYPSQVTGLDPRSVPQLWRSDDGGEGWARVAVGAPEDGAMGNSDVDLVVGPDGTIWFLVMGFDRSTGEGTHVTVGVSRDAGVSWEWTVLSETRFDDRPWISVTPDGAAHVVWNDDAGVSHASSVDGGATWTEHERIHDQGGSSHLAAGPAGELAVRISPIAASANRFHEGVDLIAVSTDGGQTWTRYEAPGSRDWDPSFQATDRVPRWVEPLAWTPDGALHYFWSSGETLHLSSSSDAGATWATHDLRQEPGVAYFPFMAVNDAGELAVTWFRQDGSELYANVGLILPGAAGEAPRLVRAEPFQTETWLDTAEQVARDAGGEYLPVIFLADGDLAVAAPLQNPHDQRYGFSFWRVQREGP